MSCSLFSLPIELLFVILDFACPGDSQYVILHHVCKIFSHVVRQRRLPRCSDGRDLRVWYEPSHFRLAVDCFIGSLGLAKWAVEQGWDFCLSSDFISRIKDEKLCSTEVLEWICERNTQLEEERWKKLCGDDGLKVRSLWAPSNEATQAAAHGGYLEILFYLDRQPEIATLAHKRRFPREKSRRQDPKKSLRPKKWVSKGRASHR